MAEALQLAVLQDIQPRLRKEKELLENYFWPEKFPILHVNGQQCFERDIKLKKERVYRLRVCIQPDYPDSLPDLVVCQSPEPMPNWTVDHTTHTWRPKDGLLRICYYHPFCWTRENMIYEIFKKGKKWLKAYENYLVSGKPINEYLPEMVPTEEEVKRAKEKIRDNIVARMSPADLMFMAKMFELTCALTTCSLENPGADITVEVNETGIILKPTPKDKNTK